MQTNICQNVQYHLSVTAEHAFLKTGRLHIIIGKFFLKFPDGIHICNDQKHSHLSHRTVGMDLVRVDHQTVSCNQMIIHTSYRGIHLPFRHMDEFHMFMQMKREVRVPPDMTVIDLFPALIKRFYCVHTNLSNSADDSFRRRNLESNLCSLYSTYHIPSQISTVFSINSNFCLICNFFLSCSPHIFHVQLV